MLSLVGPALLVGGVFVGDPTAKVGLLVFAVLVLMYVLLQTNLRLKRVEGTFGWRPSSACWAGVSRIWCGLAEFVKYWIRGRRKKEEHPRACRERVHYRRWSHAASTNPTGRSIPYNKPKLSRSREAR